MELPKEDTGGKKKKQKKPKSSKTLALNDFLADASTGTNYAKDPPKRTGSWADAMEDRLDAEGEVSTTWQGGGGGGSSVFDRSQLPSAPRKAQARNIDQRQLPKAPPYTVYLGNLSYECNEEDIVHFFGKKNLKVKEVRLPTDSGTSRLKGFGYAELESISALLEALELTGENLKNRAVTIDLATSKSGDADGPRGRYRRDSDDRTANDWRRDQYSPPREQYNGPEPYGDRYERPRGGRGYGDDYRGGYEGRGRRGYGSGGWNERPEYRDDYYGDRYRNEYYNSGYGRRRPDDRYEHRGPPRHYDDGGYRRGEYESRHRSPPLRSEPQERPRLQLQPRSKAADSAPAEGRSSIFGAAKPVDTASREQEIEMKLRKEEEKRVEEEERAQREKEMREEREKVSVFGGARPVDTASREKEIEEKLRRQEEELARRTREEGERRGSERERKGSERERRGSERERRGSERERRGSDREYPAESRGWQGHGQSSQSPDGGSEVRGKGRGEEKPQNGQSSAGDDKQVDNPKFPQDSHESHDKGRQREERGRGDQGRGGGDFEGHQNERGARRWDRSDEGDWGRGRRRGSWKDGDGRGRRPSGRGRVDSGDREQVAEVGKEWQGVGRRGERRGGGRREGERRDSRPDRDRRKGNPPSESVWSRGKQQATRDKEEPREPPPLKKYEEPAQPTFSQPSRYAMLEDEEPDPSGDGEGPANEEVESAND